MEQMQGGNPSVNWPEARFTPRRSRSLEVAVLRTGCTSTKDHPFQGYGGIPCANAGFSVYPYPAGYARFS